VNYDFGCPEVYKRNEFVNYIFISHDTAMYSGIVHGGTTDHSSYYKFMTLFIGLNIALTIG
jgi:hypothetical protein